MTRPVVAVLTWLPDGVLPRWVSAFPEVDFRDARDPGALDHFLAEGTITCGLPPVARLAEAGRLSWIQLISAGVPQDLCAPARGRGLTVTNLAGLYGPTIAEHALALMTVLARNLHVAVRNQAQAAWDRTVANTMSD